jgi:hypothetical protein
MSAGFLFFAEKLPHPMKGTFLLISIAFFLLSSSRIVKAQDWEFKKERDGIKVYTREEPNSAMKSFKGVTDLHTSMEKVMEVVGNVQNNDWWDKNITEIRILFHEKDRFVKYYLVYDVPWPLTDRDLCVESKFSADPVTGERFVNSVSLLNVVPERKDRVRIKKYWQKWIIQPKGKGVVHVTLEGSVDPGGIVPAWLYNMVITETPLKVISGIKKRVEAP